GVGAAGVTDFRFLAQKYGPIATCRNIFELELGFRIVKRDRNHVVDQVRDLVAFRRLYLARQAENFKHCRRYLLQPGHPSEQLPTSSFGRPNNYFVVAESQANAGLARNALALIAVSRLSLK